MKVSRCESLEKFSKVGIMNSAVRGNFKDCVYNAWWNNFKGFPKFRRFLWLILQIFAVYRKEESRFLEVGRRFLISCVKTHAAAIFICDGEFSLS